jgi:hypothetical protein
MPTNIRRIFTLPLALLPLLATGCGARTYESRIALNSVPFFGYLQDLNANLGGETRKRDVRFRLPATFTEIPAPKPKKSGESAARDPRLPPGLSGDLPGLVAGFRGKMKAEDAGGKTRETTAYAYVLTNRFLLASRDASAKPSKYDQLLLNTIAAGLGQPAQPNWTPKPYPVGGKDFEPSFRYDTVAFDTDTGGVPMRYEVYLRSKPPLIAAVVFVVPKNPAREEQLKKRIDLALQTLRIEGGTAAPAPAAQGGAATGGPGF